MNLLELIKNRRTVKPLVMNGGQLNDADIRQCIEAAHWAPTHGRTEPWVFFVYTGKAFEDFCLDHAEMYKATTNADTFLESKYANLKNMHINASHLVLVAMKRTPESKIPKPEEFAATAAATQNLLLMAHSLDIAAIWSTGGMALQPQMKDYLALGTEDEVMGLIYMGKTDKTDIPAKRNTTFEDKIHWKN